MLGSSDKIQILGQSAIYKQNVSISLCLSDPVQCRKGVLLYTHVILQW